MRSPETLSESLKTASENFCTACWRLSDKLRAAEKEIDDMFIKRAAKAVEKAD